jgi:glutamate synthase (NADPH) large chain
MESEQQCKQKLKNPAKGLYVPQLEKASCGIGMIANLDGRKTHQTVENALTMLQNMEHRGACGCEPDTGDGAGILIQMPHDFFKHKAKELGFELPEFGKYGVGVIFFPKDRNLRRQCRVLFNDYIDDLGFELLGYRKIPTDNEHIGESALNVEPRMEHVFVKPVEDWDAKTLERKLFILRKFSVHNVHTIFPQTQDDFYVASFSYKTVIYKGQLTTYQLRPYFPDLQDERLTSAIALVHSRFSTNTVPKWRLAQPFRYIAHNGEINTITGNVNWWRAKEKQLEAELFTEQEMELILPVIGNGLSDSACFDNVCEYLVLSGRSLPTALMMMIPEAWQDDPHMPDYKKAFYQYHENVMESWDGPASITFTNGILVGATLDRNGLRPSRYLLTDDNTLILASEAGALEVDQSKVVMKGRLQPGKMLIVDIDESRIIGDEELKEVICKRLPYREWLDANQITLKDLPSAEGLSAQVRIDEKTLFTHQQAFGYTKEDLKFLLEPIINAGEDPIGSMGTDTPLAVLSHQSQHLSNYFKQLFAQVTNPPIDPIRERSVMSLHMLLGGMQDIAHPDASNCKAIRLEHPVLTNDDLAKLKHINRSDFRSGVINTVFKADGQKGRLAAAIAHICVIAEDYVRNGVELLILSDRNITSNLAPVPSLLAVGAIHHHLIKEGLRGRTSLIVEAGDVRETHHFATLIGFGASAINPYLAFSTLAGLKKKGLFAESSYLDLYKIYQKAIGKGLLKIMSKIGISMLQAYQGAQIFEILGLSQKVVDKCFKGAVSRIEGIGFDGIAEEVLVRHRIAFPEKELPNAQLEVGGVYQWKQRGEKHIFNPKSIHYLQYSTRTGSYPLYKKYAAIINDQVEKACTLRGLFEFRKGKSIPIDQVEPIENIMKRFATGAMSFGSISHEAHTTLAIAMNRIGGKSNSGEGGEDPIRFKTKENGDSQRSAIKQVASGRFGVTSHYLTNADELQIKMAQGAKPGEGGQLPGHKVDDWIAKVRHSTPGVGLISPPPHHDVYSIEDLAQLIFDLKNANRAARINVKLVSKAGVGIIASGVAKAHADAILISGHDGGTGASPWSSIRHAGLPWELGLAESHQTLVKNKLRDRVVLQTDGQIRTGRDLAIATLLGAEEWGVATAALVVQGCIMMRKCHVNTCPVGIATQDPELRKRFAGEVDYVINFFKFLAEDLREHMAQLGFRTINEMVGKVEMLRVNKNLEYWKYKELDLSPILYKEPSDADSPQYKNVEQEHGLDDVLDWQLIESAHPALENQQPIKGTFKIRNVDRAVGTMLSNEISKRYHEKGLPDGIIHFKFKGSAGQSFGAFSAKGIHFELEGESNDYFGKGLCGSTLVVYPDANAKFVASENIIIGNVALYGATSGEIYVRGMAGERFAVRNSGATAVIEGVGDHGCEYMTGGLVVILGQTGKNFAAGMSGGIAYIYDINNDFASHCNTEMVDLEALEETDLNTVYKLLVHHREYTNSDRATYILENWKEAQKQFIKVMPREYKAVLEATKLHSEASELVAV